MPRIAHLFYNECIVWGEANLKELQNITIINLEKGRTKYGTLEIMKQHINMFDQKYAVELFCFVRCQG